VFGVVSREKKGEELSDLSKGADRYSQSASGATTYLGLFWGDYQRDSGLLTQGRTLKLFQCSVKGFSESTLRGAAGRGDSGLLSKSGKSEEDELLLFERWRRAGRRVGRPSRVPAEQRSRYASNEGTPGRQSHGGKTTEQPPKRE